MHKNEKFRTVINDKFKLEVKDFYLPDQTYINRLITSLDKGDPNNYSQSHIHFISEYNYYKRNGFSISLNTFVDGCLNQLLWINSILESGKFAATEEELDEEFSYFTPSMDGTPWVLEKATAKGVRFRGDEPFQDSRVIINSENIVGIALALFIVVEGIEEAKDVRPPVPKINESSLFKSMELQIKCLNVLKEIKYPILTDKGRFINKSGMKGAIVLWYEKCALLEFISEKEGLTSTVVANEIMKIIPNLNIDDSTFRVLSKSKKYREEIEQKLVEISTKK